MSEFFPTLEDLAENQQVQIARFGDQVRRDLSSPAVVLILTKAATAADEAIAGLAVVDPADVTAVRTLQNEFKRNRDMLAWIAAAIDMGHVAEDAILAIGTTD